MVSATAILGALLLIVLLVSLLVIMHLSRRLAEAEARLSQANQTLLSWATLLDEQLRPEAREHDLASRAAALSLQEFKADGAVFLGPTRPDSPHGYPVWGAAGECRGWFPEVDSAIDSLGAPLELALDLDLRHQFFWSLDPVSYTGEAARQWFPRDKANLVHAMLMAPVSLPDGGRGLLVMVRHHGGAFDRGDQSVLSAVVQLLETRFHVLSLERRIEDLETQVQQAHEEGMLQVASGITHNIGNAVTVIQLQLSALREHRLDAALELARFAGDELAPSLREGGDATAELAASLGEVMGRLRNLLEEGQREVNRLNEKFEDVVAVIALQQRFIGELGTENVVSIGVVLRNVETACKPALEQREIALNLRLDSTSRILVDPAMLQHVILLLVKHAIDSLTATMRAGAGIDLTTWNETMDDRDWVVVEIHDEGVNVPLDLDRGGEHSASVDQRLRDLRFCRQRVEKYGGRFAVSSRLNQGSTVRLQLPRYRD